MNANPKNCEKILFVDDDENLLASLARRLRGEYNVFVAPDGESALNLLEREGPFAVVVSDYRMPRMDGVTLLRQVRQLEPEAVTIMMTIWAEADPAISAINEARIFRFLSKPCPPGALEAALDDALEQYRLVRHEKKLMAELNEANRRLSELNRHLVSARDQAVAANQAKSEFLASISHEIRTPMTAILGYTDLLLDDELPDRERRRGLQTIRANGDYLLEIINDILDLSKIEAGRLDVERVNCSPVRILGEIASLMRVKAHAKGLGFRTDFVPPIPNKVRTDPLRVRQILINLIGNAIKFTATGGVSITVRLVDAEASEPSLLFEVKDTGIGITAEQAQRLFRPYSQGDAMVASQFGGTGLGLTISRRLAQMLGGDITFTSTPGAGSTFQTSVKVGQLVGVRMWENISEALLSEMPDASPQHIETPTDLDNLDILLAEDGEDNRRLISFLLGKAGANVAMAENGQQAVEQATERMRRGQPFDLVLMDLQMPIMDGNQAVRQLREQGYTGKIVALTAHAMPEDRSRCMAAGYDAFLAKPVDRSLLIRTIAELVTDRGHGEGEPQVCASAGARASAGVCASDKPA